MLLTVLLLPSVLVAAAYLATGSVWPNDPAPSVRGSVVEWGDRSFTNRRGFKMWLEANGGSYRRWARNHPKAAKRLSRSPKARRAVMKSAALRRPAESVGPTEQQAHFVLYGFAAAAVVFFAVALVRRIPRPSVPTLAFGGIGGSNGRTESRRSLHLPGRGLLETGLPAARRVVADHESDRIDLAFGIVSIVLGLIVGILVPIFLASKLPPL